MNVLHVEASSGWGGQEMRILCESEGMRARGHQIFLAVQKGGRLIEKAKERGFTVYALDFRRRAWPICLMQLFAILRRHRIDIVNTHSSLDAWIGGIAARCHGIRLIRTRHLSTPTKGGINGRCLYGWLADIVVTTSSSILVKIARQSKKPLSLCRCIATGVDPAQIPISIEAAETFRRSLHILSTDFVVGTACFMRSWKGIDDFLHAAHQLRSHSDIRWVIIGGGHAQPHIDRAHQLQLENIVYFTGHLDNPFPALQALDIFALLSTAHEGISQAILQAALLKKALIATPIGGLPEVCLHRITGLQVPPHAPDAVAQAVLSLQADPTWRHTLAHQAHQLVLEKFTTAQMLQAMEAVYTDLYF